jgi:hypothetical protein
MFSVMTWNLENFERPAANAADAFKDRCSRNLQQISELITSPRLDLVGDQDVLADRKNLAPSAFDDLRAGLGAKWNGQLSRRPDPRRIRAGWLSRRQLSSSKDVAVSPQQVPTTIIDGKRRRRHFPREDRFDRQLQRRLCHLERSPSGRPWVVDQYGPCGLP